nr:MAG TPA: hypothetical protein [Caudoviricetes sp.]DAV08713.1 MAG TPA: hypothetical protein [Caudoviricetes sp.]
MPVCKPSIRWRHLTPRIRCNGVGKSLLYGLRAAGSGCRSFLSSTQMLIKNTTLCVTRKMKPR